MANQSGSHGANMIVDLSSFANFQIAMRATLNRQVQAAMADLEAAYQAHGINNPQAQGVQVSVNINYNIRVVETQAGPNNQTARRNQTDIAQDISRLNLDVGEPVVGRETDQRDTNPQPNEENAPQETPRTMSALDGREGETDRPATQDNPDEEAPPSLRISIYALLLALPLANCDESPQDCPVCREPFPPFEAEADGETDEAIVLNCAHIIGFSCMENWIGRGHNSCPMCRAVVLDPAILTALADREETWGRPRPIFRTAVSDVASEVPEQHVAWTPIGPIGLSPRVDARYEETWEIREQLRALVNR